MQEYLLIIDGSSLLSTQFYGNLPRDILMAKTSEEREKLYHKIMKNSKGQYTNGIYGFLRTLFKIVAEQRPSHMAVVWDVTRDTFRRKLYPEYKGNRKETMAPLREQFVHMQEILEDIGICQFMDEEFEADDFAGSLCRRFEADIPVCVMSKDHDYLQLGSERTSVWLMYNDAKSVEDLRKKYPDADEYAPDKAFPLTPKRIRDEFGVWPHSIPALKGLMGDSADNIKGVPGVGPQTAVALIAHYETVASLYEAIDADTSKKHEAINAFWKEKLGIERTPLGRLVKESEEELVGRKAAFLCEELATIRLDLPIAKTLEDLCFAPDWKRMYAILQELDIQSLEVPDGDSTAEPALWEQEIWTREISDLAEAEEYFGDERQRKERFALCLFEDVWVLYDGETVLRLVPEGFLSKEYFSERLGAWATCGTMFYVWDWKNIYRYLPFSAESVSDLSLADYLLRPLTTEHLLESVCESWYQKSAARMSEEGKAVFTWQVGELLLEELAKASLTDLYRKIEMPLIPVLYEMEHEGIAVDAKALAQYGEVLLEGLEAEKEKIYALAGKQFNINSPKQLGEVLFEDMKLSKGKKIKSGYSTASDVLEKLRDESEIIPAILNYRHISKLQSTYVVGLSEATGPDGRIHSRFNQMVTATGRLSSTEPNLQNIPIRTQLGQELRKAFVPRRGYVFVDADYSQIELRLLAHLSGDDKLIEAFQNGEDIHRATAGQVFGIPYDKVTKEERSAAKAVNFGIVYGMGAFSLSQDLGITKKQADEYIESYFAKYPKVKSYLDGLVEQAKETGVAKTLFGRVRPIPELTSSQFMQRAFGERVAMNMPIQGTAADIMKLAMLRVYEGLKASGLPASMLLQVHDEVLIEVREDCVEQVKEIVAKAMKGAAKLLVELEIGMSVGASWYEAK